jgi:hypothetical protein
MVIQELGSANRGSLAGRVRHRRGPDKIKICLRLVLVDRVLPKVISEIKNGWLRIELM